MHCCISTTTRLRERATMLFTSTLPTLFIFSHCAHPNLTPSEYFNATFNAARHLLFITKWRTVFIRFLLSQASLQLCTCSTPFRCSASANKDKVLAPTRRNCRCDPLCYSGPTCGFHRPRTGGNSHDATALNPAHLRISRKKAQVQ